MRRTALLIAVLLAVAACSGDDGDASESESAPETSAAGDGALTEAFMVTSTAFAEGDAIPVEQAGCDGANTSPDLAWSGVPDDADQLAVTMVDPDANGFVHWVVVGIDPQETGFEPGSVPAGAVEALNGTGEPGYFGPCPPETHTYVFTVHALTDDPGVDATTPGADAVAAVETVSSSSAELTGTYTPAG